MPSIFKVLGDFLARIDSQQLLGFWGHAPREGYRGGKLSLYVG